MFVFLFIRLVISGFDVLRFVDVASYEVEKNLTIFQMRIMLVFMHRMYWMS